MTHVWRRAVAVDAEALRDVEREANLVALAHVFPPAEHPFPDEQVLARWQATLAERGVVVLLAENAAGPVAFAAYDASTLRHLAVVPSLWGTGLAREAVERAVQAIAAGGAEVAYLWVLDDNVRARGLYGHLGWSETGESRLAEWPPHPRERRLRKAL
jgi:RimJ/RimL family protein N-acetyltransferase